MAKSYKYYPVRFRDRTVQRMSRVMQQDNLLLAAKVVFGQQTLRLAAIGTHDRRPSPDWQVV